MNLRRLCGTILLAGGLLLGACWITGVVLADRFVWSQWLSWASAWTLLPGFALATVGLLALARPRREVAACVAGIALGPLLVIWGLWRPLGPAAPDTDTLCIVQWTTGPSVKSEAAFAQLIERTNPDVVVALGALVRNWGALRNWGAVPGPMRRAEFTVLSKVPLARCRSLARAHDIQLVALDLQLTDRIYRVLLVDLPSDPARSRWHIAEQAASLIDRVVMYTPDLVLGDFNMTRSSRAIHAILPDWRFAWPTRGRGWGGTWPRWLPLWRIDHVAVPPGAELPFVTTVDTGPARHRAQLIEIPLD